MFSLIDFHNKPSNKVYTILRQTLFPRGRNIFYSNIKKNWLNDKHKHQIIFGETWLHQTFNEKITDSTNQKIFHVAKTKYSIYEKSETIKLIKLRKPTITTRRSIERNIALAHLIKWAYRFESYWLEWNLLPLVIFSQRISNWWFDSLTWIVESDSLHIRTYIYSRSCDR